MAKRTLIAILLMTCLGAVMHADDSTMPLQGEQSCSALLQAAHKSLSAPSGVPDKGLFAQAFQVCDPDALSLALAARYFEAKGDYQRRIKRDPEAAAAAYEEGLERVSARGGVDAPERICLLQDTANALDELVGQGQASQPDETRARIRELSREALRVREAVYGVNSPEAAQGWCWLSYAVRDAAPAEAEGYARTAVEVSERAEDLAALRHSLWCLRSALKAQGKVNEAVEIQDRLALLPVPDEEAASASEGPAWP